MELKQLEAFRAIATLGSFSAAAQKLHTTQPAISSRIRLLEYELGAELFDRASRPARLTATGHRLIRHVERVFDATNDIRRTVGGARGHITSARIGIPGALVSNWAAYLLSGIYRDNPQARVELHIDRTIMLQEMLRNGELDFALVIGPVDDPSLIASPVAEYGYCWIGHNETAAEGQFKSIHSISGPVFTYSKASSVYRAIANYLKTEGLDRFELSGSNSTEAIVRLVKEGLGVGVVMTTALVGEGIDTNGVSELDLDTSMIPKSQYWAIYRRDGDVLLGEYLVEACTKKDDAGH